jgi:hypothetical protein
MNLLLTSSLLYRHEFEFWAFINTVTTRGCSREAALEDDLGDQRALPVQAHRAAGGGVLMVRCAAVLGATCAPVVPSVEAIPVVVLLGQFIETVVVVSKVSRPAAVISSARGAD